MLLFLSQKYRNFLNIAFLDFFKFKIPDFQHLKIETFLFLFRSESAVNFSHPFSRWTPLSFMAPEASGPPKKDNGNHRGYLKIHFNFWNLLDQYCR